MKGSLDLMKALRDKSTTFEKTEHGSYFGTTPIRRIIIYLAGPLMNIVLAVLILSVSAIIPVERISNPAVVAPISSYPELFPEASKQPGIEKGDRIISSGNTVFPDWQSIEDFLRSRQGEKVPVRISRDGELIDTVLEPMIINGNPSFGITVLIEPVVGRTLSKDFQEGDRIIEADGRPIDSQLDLYSIDKDAFTMVIERDGEFAFDLELVEVLILVEYMDRVLLPHDGFLAPCAGGVLLFLRAIDCHLCPIEGAV